MTTNTEGQAATESRSIHSSESVRLGTHSARGLAYLFGGSSMAKVVSFAADIALLYLLGKNDFGVVSAALTITVFVQVIEQGGVGDVLVHRRAFRQWAIPGFWLALALGVFSGLLIAASAPLAAALYGKNPADKQQLFWVLMIMAPSSIANALSVVPRAQLSRELRFRKIAVLNAATIALQKLLTVVLAATGFGPYSFVIPTPVVSALIAAYLWWTVRPPWGANLQLRRWRFLIGDSAQLFSAELGRALLDQSDYMMLGYFRTMIELGVYTVGFRFSIQMLMLLTANMSYILFPAFTRLNDNPQKQLDGFLKAQRILAMLGVSGCLLQAAVAAPFARFAFPAKWEPSIIVMQILSLGMATRMIGGASFALLKSQGRFATTLVYRWIFVVIQVVALFVVLRSDYGVTAVSIVVSLVASLIGPLAFHSAVQRYGLGWGEVVQVLSRPLACGIVAIGTAWFISLQMESRGIGPLPQLVEIVVVSVILNAALAWLWMRPVWDDFWTRVGQLLPPRALAWARK